MSARKTVVLTTRSRARAGGRQDGADVVEDPAGLGGDVALDERAGGRVERDLSGAEKQATRPDGLGVGPMAFGARSVAIASRTARRN